MPLLQMDETVSATLTWRINVPRSRVWQCLTTADLLSQWLGDLVSGEVAAESDFVVDHGDGYCCKSTVTTLAEPVRLDFTWSFPDEPESNLVLELDESDGDATQLRLSYGGLGDLAAS
ncbi:MAG: SRPBCC family protein [Nocardioides sp.]